MNDIQKQFKALISVFISSDKDLTEQTIDAKVDEIHKLPTFSVLTSAEVDEVRVILKSEFSIKLDKGVLIEEKGHEKWFLSRKSELDMKYWERYKKYLLADKSFSTKVVNTMDDVLDTLTDLLGDPTRDISYKRRGLIIGDVQSGKTANYTGLICKAVDSGYKVIVLLTGTIEKLRQQTQQRIDEGFVGASSDAMMKQKADQLIIGVGQYDSSIRPMVLTSTIDDFKSKNANNLNFDLRNINGPVIFVIKKNSAVLKRLNKWLKTFNQNGTQAINHSLLVIDDESDNASVNTKADPEESPTAINGHIRELLKMFSKSSYVGFTATPFANIFIDPESFNDMVAEDLFPKDYIYSLNSPSNYTGARNIFGENGDAKHMLVTISEDETDPESIASILPLGHKSSVFVDDLPRDLKQAVEAFMLANTIEDLRGLSNNHRSMLINVSRFTDVQDQISGLVSDYLKKLQAACRNYCMLPEIQALCSQYISSLKETYEHVFQNTDLKWSQIQEHIHKSCAGIVVQTFNQRAGHNVNYDDYKNGLRVIAVGGMSLSRGLTLEGLVISYFYRNSKMYDTLMQMGRWFGYRTSYADICRIWMSEESIEWYSHISQATDELRSEIKRYEDTGLTPLDFGLRVRSDIVSLLVTARNKMRSTESRECLISLSGIPIETPEIYSSAEKNETNRQYVKLFVNELLTAGYGITEVLCKNGFKVGFKNIPVSFILDLLEKIDISPKNEQFNTKAIQSFIAGYRGHELKQWDIIFPSGNSSVKSDLVPGSLVYCPERSFSVENDGKILKMSGSKRRLGTTSDLEYGLTKLQIENIKKYAKSQGISNLSPKMYFTNVTRNPLLSIYDVSLVEFKQDSAGWKKYGNESGKPYFGKRIIGFGIGIPSLSNQETKYARYVLNKVAIKQIFDGEMDDFDDEVND